jgi:AcrR family transcriptional regulator
MANVARHPAAPLSALAERRREQLSGRRERHGPASGEDVGRRLAAAWAESLPGRGYHGTTVQHLVDLSGISRSVFYRHFAGKEDAFVAIHADALAWFTARVGAAAAGEPDWPRQVAAGLAAALAALAEEPREAQLLLGDPMSAGPRMGYCQELLGARFSPCLSLGRRVGRDPPPPPSIEAALIGALVGIVSSRLRSGSVRILPALAPALTEFVLSPYVGADEAMRLTLPAARFERAFAGLRTRIEAACAGQGDWPARVAAGVGAAFAFAAEDPAAARALTSEALARGNEGQAQHRRMVSHLAALLRSARGPGPDGANPSEVADDAVTGGIALLAGRLLDAGREGELRGVAAEAAQLILIPQVGLDEARRIAASQSTIDS